MKITVIGSGSFGTSLAMLLTNKGHEVTLYGRNEVQMKMIAATRGNHRYLPGVFLPADLKVSSDLENAVRDRDLLVMAVPAQSFRNTAEKVSEITSGTPILNVAKGLEIGTLKRMSEIAGEYFPEAEYACLSGPSHAEEVARNLPTTVCVASENGEFAKDVQKIFMNDFFRVHTNDDLIGVELGGAIKNVIALGCGISDGLGLGDNAKAALITRGIAEMTRLGVAMGGIGSDAAIEAADVVLMYDSLTALPEAKRIAKKTMSIVWQNIIFALGVKLAVLLLTPFGLVSIWLAIFADVGVAVLAILNAMRTANV
jgi:glycerol-3-phosphate dehydrogenase (NAD(P)+)